MKSAKKIMVAVCMMAAMMVVLCSCGGANNDGVYVVQSLGGMDIQQLLDMYSGMGGDAENVPKSAEDIMTLEIKGSNFTLNSKMDSSQNQSGTCEISGETIKLTINGETASGTIKDGVVTITEGGTSMTFKKK